MTATTPANSLQGNLRALRLPYMLEHALSAAQETQPAPAPPTCVSLKTSLPGKPPCSTTAPSPGALPPPASPSFKSMAAWDWNWPKKFNRMQIEHLLRLDFLDAHDNVILAGPTGVGKTHLALALGHAACLRGKSVLFTPAIDVVNRLSAAESTRQLHREMRRYLAPSLIILDELGYLPLDKRGAELLFQVISKRYEAGSILVTTNIAFKDWPQIFAGDATMTSALLDRLLHHAHPVLIEGDSYRCAKRK